MSPKPSNPNPTFILVFTQEKKKIKMKNEKRRPGILEFGGGLFLDAENDGVGAADADGGVAFTDGFESVLDLKEMTIW